MHSPESRPAVAIVERIRLASGSRFSLYVLVCLHIVVCCLSLVQVANWQSYMLYDDIWFRPAIAAVAAFSTVSLLFIFARFSFGYFVGFSLFTMVLGFIWLLNFSRFKYDYRLAGLSAAASALAFLLPALLINRPLKQKHVLSPRALQYVLNSILALAIGTIVAASFYNFNLVSIRQIYDFRNELYFPAPIRYLTGIISTVLLPFAFACYLALNRRWWAVVPLVLMLLFYPITLSKFALFSTAWIVVVLILSRLFDPRAATILSTLLPMLLGVILVSVQLNNHTQLYFGLVNIRMMAAPSSAMDLYNDFFASHPLTWFCQVSFVKPLVSCPYQEQLSLVMEKTYQLGNINASLFATEGIASVGLYLAPLVALLCGLVIALGNRVSAGLPPAFVMVSGALLPQTFLNVPFTTALLTHGTVFLFLLWYVMPRTMFDPRIEPAAS
ncbi:hypothetical protein CQ14_30655 [Bradyrhizobium lablabi]|uniref:Oligosaccharide repeat unit polymerase n=2 Tax=Bradyrhizobium lablabi TaxID=722472 RepID=A0A0R3MZQ9_9BRAD|nr:hypothetical protein CQ14_30655 [Bradyrhizobium lablabi]